MRKILLSLFLLTFAFATTVTAQVKNRKQITTPHFTKKTHTLQRYGTGSTQSVSGIIREGFELPTFPPVGWQAIDVFGPEVWLRSTMIPHAGAASAFCLYEQAAAYGEDWLIMPKFNVVATDSLHFWLGITDPGFPDSLYVLISTTDSALTSFTNKELILSDGNGYPTVHYGFVQKGISLAAYAGQSIYVAFRNWNINGDGVSIDDVELGTPPAGDVASISWDKAHLLGDSAQTPIATVKNVGTATQTFNVTMTISGGYTSTKTVTALAPNATKQISFSSWTPTVIGTNTVKMYTQLAGDGYLLNDTLTDALQISHISNDDIKMVSIDLPKKTGDYAQTPKATVRNNGYNAETFSVKMTISGGYSSTMTVTNLAPFATQQVSFASWTPTVIGNNTVKAYSQLASDAVKTNDTLQNIIQVFQEFVNYGWSSQPTMPINSAGNASAFYHQGVSPNDTSIVFSIGGVAGGPFLNDNNAFSSLTNSWAAKTPAPVSKSLGSAQTVNGKIYYMGGIDGSFASVKTNNIYDIKTDSWSVGADMPEELADFGSAVYKDSLIYIVGGYDLSGAPTNAVRVYNPSSNTWTTATAKTNTATHGVRCGIYQNKIVSVGGYDGTSPINEAILGTINPATPNVITWSALPNYPGFPVLRHSGSSVYKDELPLVVFTSGDTAGYSNLGVTYYTMKHGGMI